MIVLQSAYSSQDDSFGGMMRNNYFLPILARSVGKDILDPDLFLMERYPVLPNQWKLLFTGGLHSKNGLPINLERSVFNARSSGLFLVSITTVLNSWQALPFIDFTGEILKLEPFYRSNRSFLCPDNIIIAINVRIDCSFKYKYT